jgi:signal transduction histidine kinase/CheY-like chemotaxis protein
MASDSTRIGVAGSSGPEGNSASHHLARAPVWTTVIVGAGVSAFELIKTALFPRITLWTSHIATIVFMTVVSLVVVRFALRRHSQLLNNAVTQLNERRRLEKAEYRCSEVQYQNSLQVKAGRPLHVIGHAVDISDRSRMEEVLRRPRDESETKVLDLATDFSLRDCLELTLKTLALRAQVKGLELLCEVAHEVPEIMRGVSNRLHRVVINLVGNAIKFTDEGEVALKVQIEAEDGHDRILRFTVSDTGIGIPKDKQESIFDSFSQADTSTTRKYGGTGLGLTISARLVAMMGGKIWVESEPGRGSEFHFTVRLGVVDAKEINVVTVAPPELLRGVKVLVVDDNPTNRRILEGMLGRWEMKPTLVEGGEEALAELSAAREAGEPYALILTDMHMPGMDGFALVERIRQRPELSTATIMMLTSAGHRRDAARCQDLGVSAYLLKPIRQSELREAIALVFRAREQEGVPLITRFSLQDGREPAAFLRVLVAEDNLVNQRLAVRLLEKRGHRVEVAVNGREALQALEKERFDLVRWTCKCQRWTV